MAPVKQSKTPAKGKGKAKVTARGKTKANDTTTTSAGVPSTPAPSTRQTRQARRTQLLQQAQQMQQPPAPTHRQLPITQSFQRRPSIQIPNLVASLPAQQQNTESFLQSLGSQQMQHTSFQSFQDPYPIQLTASTQTQQMGSQVSPFSTGMQQPQQTSFQPFPFLQQPQQMQHQPFTYTQQPQQMQTLTQMQPFTFNQQPQQMLQQPFSSLQQRRQRRALLFPSFQQIQQPRQTIQQQTAPIFTGNLVQSGTSNGNLWSATTPMGTQNDAQQLVNRPLVRVANTHHAGTQPDETSQPMSFMFTGNEAQATQGKQEGARKRRAEDGDDQPESRKTIRRGRPQKEQEGRCDQCFERGVQICDLQEKIQLGNKECTQCTEFRYLSGNIHHTCTAPKNGDGRDREYSVQHPMEFPDATCTFCVMKKRYGKCDIDMLLGYSCTFSNKKAGGCTLPGSDTKFAKRPGKPNEYRRWFRHACDSCQARASSAPQQAMACSWLDARSRHTSACDQCRARGLACFDGAQLVEQPPAVEGYSANLDMWSYDYFGPEEGHIELYKSGGTRLMCQQCCADDAHCRISGRRPFSACSRCTTMGIDCVEVAAEDRPSREFPIYSLSVVGFGTCGPFHSCQRCIATGRNCDRQRPCDSCCNNNEQDQCDKVSPGRIKAADRQMIGKKNVFKGRLKQPGPLYYLAMGYGPGGVDDKKDGSALEHWYGPVGPLYARKLFHFAPPGHIADISHKRNYLRPDGRPPQDLTTADMPSRLTAQRLQEMLLACWPVAFPPNQGRYWDMYGSEAAWAQALAGADRRDIDSEKKALDKKRRKQADLDAADDDNNTDAGDANGEEQPGEQDQANPSELVSQGYEVSLSSQGNAMVQQTLISQAVPQAAEADFGVDVENFDYHGAMTDASLNFGDQGVAYPNEDEDVDMAD